MRPSYLLNSLFALTLALFLTACSDKDDAESKIKIPPNILKEEVFAKMLTDFALAEAAANMNVKNAPAKRLDTVYAFDPLKDNHVSKARYDSTVSFYAQHTELYKKVYESVLAALSEMQTRRDSLKTDSLSK